MGSCSSQRASRSDSGGSRRHLPSHLPTPTVPRPIVGGHHTAAERVGVTAVSAHRAARVVDRHVGHAATSRGRHRDCGSPCDTTGTPTCADTGTLPGNIGPPHTQHSAGGNACSSTRQAGQWNGRITSHPRRAQRGHACSRRWRRRGRRSCRPGRPRLRGCRPPPAPRADGPAHL